MQKISFEPIKIRRLSEFIENYIRNLILKGEVEPGERLPSEKEIGKQFGVSIVTVREALRGLEAFGLIEKKKGKGGGIFIRESKSDPVKIALHNFLSSKKFSSQHITELRLIIEPVAVKIASAKITAYEIKTLEKNIKYCERKITKLGHTFPEHEFFDLEERNVEFHRLIAEATQNPILALTIDYAMDFLFSFKKSILTPDLHFSSRTIKDHRTILTHLQEGDAEAGAREMVLHLKKVEEYLSQKEGYE
jgi:GntR family transcriptional repressor for pyruvate dehydrogenase complex